jgi:type VI secretion system Hcp family effector
MAFRISVNIPGRTSSSNGGQLFAMAYGTVAITPRNLEQMLGQMRSESAVIARPLAGKRQHKPLTITKEWGVASPLYLNAHWTSEVLQSVVIQITGPGSPQGGSQETLHHTISLTNAQIVGYTRNVRPPFKPGHGGSSRSQLTTNELEEVQLVFQKITFTNVLNSKSASDDWTAGK